eukprot:4286354-Amphidinium_carterae.1
MAPGCRKRNGNGVELQPEGDLPRLGKRRGKAESWRAEQGSLPRELQRERPFWSVLVLVGTPGSLVGGGRLMGGRYERILVQDALMHMPFLHAALLELLFEPSTLLAGQLAKEYAAQNSGNCNYVHILPRLLQFRLDASLNGRPHLIGIHFRAGRS